jgi:putative transposase
MSEYRRAYQPGGFYFFTVVTHQRKPILCTEQSIARLRESFRYTMQKYPFEITAIVILPDHLHCIWQLPENDSDFSKRWNMIKRHFSMGISSNTNHRREKNIWQRRFWEHLIQDEKDLHRHLHYIYYNPVKHGYVSSAFEWPHSSFKKDVEHGLYDKSWGSGEEPSHIKALNFE